MAQGSAAGATDRGRGLAAGLTRRRLALPALLGVFLALGGCSSFSGFVADTWPTWAGGMPKDVPPRPGAPGYEEFLAHQQRQDAAGGAPRGTSTPTTPGAPGYEEFLAHQQRQDAAGPPPGDTSTQTTAVVAAPNKTGSRTPSSNQP